VIISATSFFDKGLMLTVLKIEPNQLIQPIEPKTEPRTGLVKTDKKPRSRTGLNGELASFSVL